MSGHKTVVSPKSKRMEEDFKNKISRLNTIGIIQVCSEFYERPDRRGFVHSPVTKDKTRSMKLYEKTNSYYDFAGGKGGDIVSLVSYAQKIDNWQALKMLCDFYGLSGKEENRRDIKKQIRSQEEQRRKEKEQKALKQRLWLAKVDGLKTEIAIYETLLQSSHVEPLSDIWCYCKNQKQLLEYRLDLLCGLA